MSSYLRDRFVLYLIAGILGVANMIIWGIYGDLLAENFNVLKLLRSLFLGVIYSVLIFFSNPQLPLFIVALCTIALERATTEIYKPLIRKEAQKKYRIRSDLNLRLPYPLGQTIGYVLIVGLSIAFLSFDWKLIFPKIWLALAVGMLVALSGMAKDAPKEGFKFLTFLRTPFLASIFGVFLAFLFPTLSARFYILAVAGGERILSECYKKILCGREPGKFKNSFLVKKVWRKNRWTLLPLYILDLGLIFLMIFVK